VTDEELLACDGGGAKRRRRRPEHLARRAGAVRGRQCEGEKTRRAVDRRRWRGRWRHGSRWCGGVIGGCDLRSHDLKGALEEEIACSDRACGSAGRGLAASARAELPGGGWERATPDSHVDGIFLNVLAVKIEK
jgi:hypothetical protein